MTTPTVTEITQSNLHSIRSLDLREAAEQAWQAHLDGAGDPGDNIIATRYMEPHYRDDAIGVETLVFRRGGRAGQVTTGDAVWGDWIAGGGRDYLLTDEGIRVYLDGREEE